MRPGRHCSGLAAIFLPGLSPAASAQGLPGFRDGAPPETSPTVRVLVGKDGQERKYRVAGLPQFEDGVKVAVLLVRLGVAVNAVTGGDRSDWFSTKKK